MFSCKDIQDKVPKNATLWDNILCLTDKAV